MLTMLFTASFLCKADTVGKGEVYSYVLYYGRVTSAKEAYVYSPYPGKLIKYTVQEGQYVSKGETIALIDRDIPGMKTKPVKINSPVEGYIGLLYLHRGSTASSSLPIALVFGGSAIVEMDVSSSVIQLIRNAGKAYIETAHGDIPARITSVSRGVDMRTGLGKIRLNLPKGGVVMGDIVPVKLVTGYIKNAVYVDKRAVIKRDNNTYVFKYVKGKVKQTKVDVLLEGDKNVAIDGKLSVGDTIITVGSNGLYDNVNVVIKGIKHD